MLHTRLVITCTYFLNYKPMWFNIINSYMYRPFECGVDRIICPTGSLFGITGLAE